MERLKALLKSSSHGGVYWYTSHGPTAELEKLVTSAGWSFFHIEGQKLMRKEQFLNHAALAMHFPEYFGDNWDAFEDCLTDLSWIDAAGFLILYDHVDVFAEHAPQHFDTVMEIFAESTQYWAGQGKPMIVLLRGKHPVVGLETIA